jgi:hypothetical protein
MNTSSQHAHSHKHWRFYSNLRSIHEKESRFSRDFMRTLLLLLVIILLMIFAFARVAHTQVIVVDKNGNFSNGENAPVDRRYKQIEPTKVELPKPSLDYRSRLDLLRALTAEQGFAMRPFPRGHKGLELEANGKLKPAGEAYVDMASKQGIAANPGERLIITDLKIEGSKIIFNLNGGPDPKHRFLSHISIGMGPAGTEAPIVQGDQQAPTGARLTLLFDGGVPQVTPQMVKALLAPLISFDVKTPIQAFTDTLPLVLKDAILDHHVLVGMSTDMLLFAMGEPDKKSREVADQMPIEEWIYGHPPADVQFVRVNGNRVIRVEVAKVGYPPKIFTEDVVSGMMRTDGTPLEEEKKERTVEMGDVRRDPNTQSPTPAPTLAKPGEKIELPAGQQLPKGVQQESGPVRFPKQSDPNAPQPQPDTETQPAAGETPSGQATTDQAEDGPKK